MDVTGNNVDIYTDTNAQCLKFTIDRVLTGAYQGLYLIRYGDKYLAQDSNYNVYVNASKSSATYWSFMAVEKRFAELFCHDYTYTENNQTIFFDTSKQLDYFKTVLGTLDYSAWAHENPSAALAYEFLQEDDDVFVFMGHGGPGIISFCVEGNTSTGAIAVNNVVASRYVVGNDRQYIMALGKNELALTRCVIYLGCSTGVDITCNGTTYNLVDTTYEKGAHFVLGTTETLNTSQLNNWIEFFLDALEDGNNISNALEYANDELGIITVSFDKEDGSEGYKEVEGLPTYCVGDQSQCLNIG